MREDTNFKGSDLSCPSIYFLFYAYNLIKTRISVSVHCQYKHHQTGADIVLTITSIKYRAVSMHK